MAVAIPALSIAAYSWAYEYEKGYLSAYQALNTVTQSYITVEWSLFIPTFTTFCYLALYFIGALLIGNVIGNLILLIFAHLTTAKKTITDIIGPVLLVFLILIVCGFSVIAVTNTILGDAAPSFMTFQTEVDTASWMYRFKLALFGLLGLVCIAAINAIIVLFFRIVSSLSQKASLFAKGITAATILTAIVLSVPLIGEASGRSAGKKQSEYQVILYNNDDYGVIKRYGSYSVVRSKNFLDERTEEGSTSKIRRTYVLPESAIQPFIATPQRLPDLQSPAQK